MGNPAIYVWDVSNAAIIIESFNQFSLVMQQEKTWTMTEADNNVNSGNGGVNGVNGASSHNPLIDQMLNIHLAACDRDEILPMNPEVPADLFTSCLTTPIKTALQWHIRQNSNRLIPGITMDSIDNLPGSLGDRRTLLGEINWIFTAVTDSIAYSVLPKTVFQHLFRQDLMVASLFRNFLLAQRIMSSYHCNPVSDPRLPNTSHHPMWQAWDMAVDQCLQQLPVVISNPQLHIPSPFFSDQLTAFQIWLSLGDPKKTQPEQLPIVLQVLLSQAHRLRALDLLSQYLDIGRWAVITALSVGIFPYMLKLLQSSCLELRPLLVFIWSKILAVDVVCLLND